jgi:integrase
MRKGQVFRYCTKDSARIVGRACPKCGNREGAWGFVVDTAGPGEPRHQERRRGFKTRAAAVEALSRFQVDKAEGRYVEPSKQTLAQYLADWLAAGCDHVRGSTRTGYEVVIRKHVGPALGSRPLQQLDRLRVARMYHDLREGGLSEKSVRNVHIVLNKALQYAVEHGLLRANPARGTYQRPSDEKVEMATWTLEEVQRFLDFTANDRDAALWRTALQTGMRRGELLGLRWRDVDLEGARLHVRQQWSRQDGALVFGPPKTRQGRRTIDLDPGTVDALRRHRDAQKFERRAWGAAYRSELDLVFCLADGRPFDPDVASHRFLSRAKAAKVGRIRFHDCRHTHAVLLLEAGVDILTVSKRLGHASVEITLSLYGHVTPKLAQGAAAKIGELVDALRTVGELANGDQQ